MHDYTMKKKAPNTKNVPGYTFIDEVGGISEYVLKTNGLTVLHKNIPDTEVVTSNITYAVGSRDEANGETGIAHMLEHMLFKPTTQDLKKNIDSSAMQLERETGCIINANTWKDRTTYFFSYPVEHFSRALQVEAERMQDVVITDKEFLPERGNVLSEFDMYNGDPHFALNVQMVCAAFHSHPYGHETIGFREDIERYTPEKLQKFYTNYYRPDNATLTIVGDISLRAALSAVKKEFAHLKNPAVAIVRHNSVEPAQEGLQRVSITRPSSTNLLMIGIKHEGFPNQSWLETSALLSVLTGGTDSILHTRLVDTGFASSVQSMLEPTSEKNLGMIIIALAPGSSHTEIETMTRSIITSLRVADITKLLKKVIQSEITEELFARGSSLHIAMELTEYISANTWQSYFDTVARLKNIKPADLITMNKKLFVESQMTIGYFIGTK